MTKQEFETRVAVKVSDKEFSAIILELTNQTGAKAPITMEDTTMRIKRVTPKVSKQRAIEIAMNHNCVSVEIAENYTDSELREVLRVLGLKANF